jgi:hypothetical protein
VLVGTQSAQAQPTLTNDEITFVTMLANPDGYYPDPYWGGAPTPPIVPAPGYVLLPAVSSASIGGKGGERK